MTVPRRLTVVGSGPSGVQFAETALAMGHQVTMVDVGRTPPPVVLPDAGFDDLKLQLDDPSTYFLGTGFEGALLPDNGQEYYGIPPNKQYVFETPSRFAEVLEGFAPLFSFAGGGLAEAWTAGCYPFNREESEAFPFPYESLVEHYEEVALRIGVTGADDDLAKFMPLHRHLMRPLPFDEHSELLMRTYGRRRDRINRATGVYFGRTRVATLSEAVGDRHACNTLGRCLWGCPNGSIYTPSQTLRQLHAHTSFRYLPGLEVQHFALSPEGRATSLVARHIGSGETSRLPVDQLVLAAGALPSAAIVLRSVAAATGEHVRLEGLMDNRQVLVPFLNFRMLGRTHSPRSYQYHLLGLGLDQPKKREYVHGQITTLKTALMHPIIQQLPFGLRTSMLIARRCHAALGVVNVNFHDDRRASNTVELAGSATDARLSIRYAPADNEPERIGGAMKRLRRALLHLGCVVPPGMQHVRPMGASVHYAGLFPMSAAPNGRWTTDPYGRMREFPNVSLVDGSTFPFLPAKNLTFTLMANASRIAASEL